MTGTTTTDPGQVRMMENLYWWGIPTLFRCPVETDPAACDIALGGGAGGRSRRRGAA